MMWVSWFWFGLLCIGFVDSYRCTNVCLLLFDFGIYFNIIRAKRVNVRTKFFCMPLSTYIWMYSLGQKYFAKYRLCLLKNNRKLQVRIKSQFMCIVKLTLYGRWSKKRGGLCPFWLSNYSLLYVHYFRIYSI